MEINLAEKLKSLRKEKNVSQEKLARYLNVSFQAVSRWETGGAYPDISLLPEIARFFGITVDELLQAEKLDEKKLYQEYEDRGWELWRNGRVSEMLALWEEAYHKMPNNVEVKEMLMSAYFDMDKAKYRNEIIELGTELYNSDVDNYYKGQAIEEIAFLYAEEGDIEMAKRWVRKSYQIIHSQEMLYMGILTEGKYLIEHFRYINYWYLRKLFYLAACLSGCKDISGGIAYTQAVGKAVVQLYELVYPGDDMEFESLKLLCSQHRGIAEDEIALGGEESVVRHHLTRAMECARKSLHVVEHDLTHPLVMGWKVFAAPSDNKQVMRMLKEELAWECFDSCRDKDWFAALEKEAAELAE